MNDQALVQSFIDRARVAQKEFEKYSQEDVDKCVRAIGKVVYDHAELLAKEAAEETGMGRWEDKIGKNMGKAKTVWWRLKGVKSRGIISENKVEGIVEVARPVGVVGAVCPTTNPNITPMQNAMIALKGGNAIVICPHPRAKKTSKTTVNLMREALQSVGAPVDLIQLIEEPTMELSAAVMAMTDVCISTGGPSVVKVAYASGKPAFGVGAGNNQVLIDKDADLDAALPMIVAGRSSDNGILCTCEQSIHCPRERYDEIVSRLETLGAYYISDPATLKKLRDTTFPDGNLNKDFVGASVAKMAQLAGIEVPAEAKILLVKAEGTGRDELFGREKMCPILAIYAYDTWEEAVDNASANLEMDGKGHSCMIHSFTKENIEYAAQNICVSRFAVNQPGPNSLGGSLSNNLNPTTTLGCGSWGNNSISENLYWHHLVNVSRIAYVVPGMKIPTDEEIWG